MDGVGLVVGALAAGALRGVGESAAAAVRDAYAELKDLVRGRLGQRRDAGSMLERFEADPEGERAAVADMVRAAGLASDEAVVAAAQRLVALLGIDLPIGQDPRLDLRGAQGIQVGDGNVQVNSFGGGASR